MEKSNNKPIPIIPVGRYAGTPVDQLPNSYLRWIVTQHFSKDILECALRKLEDSEYGNIFINVSRHAIDMFSKRFLFVWAKSEADKGEDAVGLATFVATLAQAAWDKGVDTSKHRYQYDGVVKELDGIKWVFGVNPNYPEYHDVITVME